MPKAKTTSSASNTSTNNKVENMKSTTVANRKATRSDVLSCEDNREFHPLDYDLIRPLVRDTDVAKFEVLKANGEKGSVEIDLNRDYESAVAFLRGWLRANGKNRSPKPNHYGYLADEFRTQFVPEATSWVVDANGMVGNGGHSGHAVVLAFYPESLEYGITGVQVLDKEGKPIPADSDEGQEAYLACGTDDDGAEYDQSEGGLYYAGPDGNVWRSSPLAWKKSDNKRVGEYDPETDQYIIGTDSPDIRESQRLVITLHINADPRSCLKMDDVRLEASYDDFLEMVAPIRAHLEVFPKIVKENMGTILRNYYLRVNHKGDTFGFLGKGGRLNKADVQQWYLAAVPQLLDCVSLLANNEGVIVPFPHFTKAKNGKGGVSVPHALVAMMVCDQAGREKIAKVLTSSHSPFPGNAPEYVKSMVAYLVRTADQDSINADQIVQTLVLLGNGSKDPVATMKADHTRKVGDDVVSLPPWQVLDLRASGWDRSDTEALDDGEEQFSSVCVSAAQAIAEILGSEGNVASAKRKAPRKPNARTKNKGK